MKGFVETALDLLDQRGPMEIFTLVRTVLRTRTSAKPGNRPGNKLLRMEREQPWLTPLKQKQNLLGDRLFRMAKQELHGLVVREYPSFRLKETVHLQSLPKRGRLRGAYDVLAGSRQYTDLRTITQRAIEARRLVSVSPIPEYWMYEALTLEVIS